MFLVAMVLAAPCWFLIKFQVSEISSEYSVGLRFLIASIAIEMIRRVRGGGKVSVPLQTYGMIAVCGFTLYAVNFWLCYESSKYMTSGLIAAVASTMIIPNLIFGRVFLNREITLFACFGAFFALTGVALLFKDDLMAFDIHSSNLIGLGLVFMSTFLSVTGTILSGKLMAREIPTLFVLSRAMGMGAILSIAFNALVYGNMSFPVTFSFLGSLGYLSLCVTTTLYILYSNLIKEWGPGAASLLWVFLPIVTLGMSAIFENYQWTVYSTGGLLFIVLGGCLSTYSVKITAFLKGLFNAKSAQIRTPSALV